MIDLVWWDRMKGSWDSGLLRQTFEKYPEIFREHNSKELIFPERAIVIVVGKPEIAPLRAWLETLKSGLVILTSEEDAYFDYHAAIPEHLEIWTSYYHACKADIKERILLGPPSRIKDYKINTHLPKKYLWSFVGQMQNPFRNKAVNILKGLLEGDGELSNGFLHRAPMFGGQVDGIEYQEYLDIMCQSKYVICPTGSMCVDSFRFYEALECGAIPITDRRSPRDEWTFNYWYETIGDRAASIIWVNDWEELPELLRDNPTRSSEWWETYKAELTLKLLNYAVDGNKR